MIQKLLCISDCFLPDCRSAAGMALPLMCRLSCPTHKNVVLAVSLNISLFFQVHSNIYIAFFLFHLLLGFQQCKM